MKKLTVQQENFCNKYVECGNASEACRFAYSCNSWKDEAIWTKGSKLLASGKVAVRVSELQAEVKAKSDITKERVLEELGAILEARVSDYVTIESVKITFEDEEYTEQRVTFKDFADLTDKQLRAVESVKKGKFGIELKLHGKSWTIERICKMLGFDEPIKQDINLQIEQPLFPKIKITT